MTDVSCTLRTAAMLVIGARPRGYNMASVQRRK